MLLTVVPLDRREDGVEDEDEAPEAPAMLCVEGEAGGRRWDKELKSEEVNEEKLKDALIKRKLNSNFALLHFKCAHHTCTSGGSVKLTMTEKWKKGLHSNHSLMLLNKLFYHTTTKQEY